MKYFILGLLISCITMLSFCLIFKNEISHKIMTTKCAKFDFYEVEIDLCDQHSIETFQAEKDSIENTVDDLRNTLVKLKKQNSALREQLQSLTSTYRSSSPTVLQSPEVEISKILSRSEIYIPQ